MLKHFLPAMLAFSFAAHAVTVKHEQGELTLDKTPERIVVLEFSFADALAQVDVKPVGVADDNDAARLLPQIRERAGEYTSVGTRSQPNLETIASLKPDLIIADKDRHTAAYDELQKIAPVLLLNSRHGTYDDILDQAQTIGEVVGKGDAMKAKIAALEAELSAVKAVIPQGQTAFVGSSREDGFHIHSKQSYAGALLARLGFDVPDAPGNKPIYDAGLEQVLALDPDWLFIAHYRDESMVKKWEQEALWPALKAAKANQVVSIDTNLWSRARGLYAASAMAEQVRAAVAGK